jgi:serine/threonine protein kinase
MTVLYAGSELRFSLYIFAVYFPGSMAAVFIERKRLYCGLRWPTCGEASVAGKIPIERMIAEVAACGLYDRKTLERLAVIVNPFKEAADISRKERTFTEKTLGQRVEEINSQGKISFHVLARSQETSPGAVVTCHADKFLGYGNMGPVFAVTVNNKPFALKIYSAPEIQDVARIHGPLGIGGMLQDLAHEDGPTFLSKLGQKVLARKPTDIYARSKKIVKIHNVGQDGEYIYLLMDLLAVDTINRVNPARLGENPIDLISWAADCTLGMCQLHVEERRLHLNIRPEAFIRRDVQGRDRLPKFTFFHFPQKYCRPKGSQSLNTEFVMVDHFDTSLDVRRRELTGLGTVGSWLFIPPEVVMQLLKALKTDYLRYVLEGAAVEQPRSINLKRSQMDDIWALGLTLYQFLSGGRLPFADPKSLSEMINSILLSKFDFSQIPPDFRPLIEAMLTKDTSMRFQRVFEGCPENVKSRKVMAEAILYKLEVLSLSCSS